MGLNLWTNQEEFIHRRGETVLQWHTRLRGIDAAGFSDGLYDRLAQALFEATRMIMDSQMGLPRTAKR